MKTFHESEFLRWANRIGLFIDERYPQSAVLSFRPDPQLDRFWEVPPEPERRPYFVASMLDLMGAWQSCYVWRHLGSWPEAAAASRINERRIRVVRGDLNRPAILVTEYGCLTRVDADDGVAVANAELAFTF